MSTTRSSGRPRDSSVDSAVLGAAVARLSSDGYERMTIDDIARDAGVSRPTVYRRWPSKEELVIAAMASLIAPSRREPSGDVRADLMDIANSLHARFEKIFPLGLLGAALTERDHHPEIFEAYKQRLVVPRRSSIRDVLERGISDGVVRKDVDIDIVVAMFVGSFHARSLAEEWEEGDNWPTRIVDAVMALLSEETDGTQLDRGLQLSPSS